MELVAAARPRCPVGPFEVADAADCRPARPGGPSPMSVATLPPSVHQPVEPPAGNEVGRVRDRDERRVVVDRRVAVAQPVPGQIKMLSGPPSTDSGVAAAQSVHGSSRSIRGPTPAAPTPHVPEWRARRTQHALRLVRGRISVFRGDRCCRPDGRGRRRRLDRDDGEGGRSDRLRRRRSPASTGVLGVVSHGFSEDDPEEDRRPSGRRTEPSSAPSP